MQYSIGVNFEIGFKMYSVLKNVQILVSSLKAHGVRNVVHCPGGADMPIGISLDSDDFFNCYSVVDERSAVYFAIGISMANGNSPVAVLCTSGTAVSNFHSGMEEAFYKGVPVIAITADRSPYLLDQFEIQKIDQRKIFAGCSKHEVDLPIVNNGDEAAYCDRLVNTALLEMSDGIPGPIHINVPTVGKARCVATSLPNVKVIKRIRLGEDEKELHLAHETLKNASRILVVVGENSGLTDADKRAMEEFHDKYGAVYSVEHMSNYKGAGSVISYRVTEAMASSAFDQFMPDLVIDFGGHIATVKLKAFLRERAGKFIHWSIQPDGRVRDGFKTLTNIFVCKPGEFFSYFNSMEPSNCLKSGADYYNAWKDAVSQIDPPIQGLSNFRVASSLAQWIPQNSYLELGILNSIRVMQFFDLDPSITVSANIGGLGIDGCLSTAVGKAAAVEEKVFIMQGDLSFFYDMNALNIRYVKSNLRVLLVNNGGAAEFHIGGGRKVHPDIDNYLAAKHGASARGWAEECGFKYLGVSDVDDLEDAMKIFTAESNAPILLEIFTDRDFDAEMLDTFYSDNSGASSSEKARSAAKFAAKRLISMVQK